MVNAQEDKKSPEYTDLASFIDVAERTLVRVVGPQRVDIDPQTKIAKVRLYNPGNDTAKVRLELRFTIPKSRKQIWAEDLLSPQEALREDSMARETAHLDSLASLWSLAPWIKEPLPARIWLAPHQRVLVTLHLDVPDGLQPGEYSTYLVANDDDEVWISTKNGSLPFLVPDDKLPPVAAQLVYTVRATSP